MEPCVNIHTHRPAGYGIELRTAGVHPWEPDLHAAERLAEVLGAQLANQSGPSDGSSAPQSAAEVPTVGMRVPEKPNGRDLDTEEPNRRERVPEEPNGRERDTESPTRTTGSAESRDSATGPALIRTTGTGEWQATGTDPALIRTAGLGEGQGPAADPALIRTTGTGEGQATGTDSTLIRTAGTGGSQVPATGPALIRTTGTGEGQATGTDSTLIRTAGTGGSQVPATGPALIRTAGLAAEWMEITEVAAAGIQAIGEIGLDFACRSDRTLQTEVLRIQLRLARRTGLPVVLHCVRAFEPLMRELAACRPREVIFHGFIGSPEQARTALSHGCYLSFGERTFASPKSLRALHEVPLDRLFLETDDAPVSIERIYDRAARELGLEVGVLRRATYENYKRIFEPKHENG